MKPVLWILGIIVVLVVLFYAFNNYIYTEKQGDSPMRTGNPVVEITPIEHATMVIRYDEAVLYIDPTGGAEAFAGLPAPTIILITDIHGDHLSTSTIDAVAGTATIIAPQAVADLMPERTVRVVANGETTTEQDFEITAVPMYNLPGTEGADRHVKGRGNGYIIERDGGRMYIAGDTAGTAEMRSLTNIDVAFVPMNFPYTMSVDEAASAVLDFKPKLVYPYHYRTPEGLADVDRFKNLVTAGDPNIQVTLLNWYP